MLQLLLSALRLAAASNSEFSTCSADVPHCSHAASESLEDNMPRLPPRKGDAEMQTEALDVLSGAEPGHFHGALGRLQDGSLRLKPKKWPSRGLTLEETQDAHRGFSFNSWRSDSISVDREQPDTRSRACRSKHATYSQNLPAASVIIVFHNEIVSVLLRSVHSVLNHSPPKLIQQIILVDDASEPVEDRFSENQWTRLQDELAEYCRNLPKVLLVRLHERRGLMMARMEGVWRATGDAVLFLDSHIEATPGWIEPLLTRVKDVPSHIVLPKVEVIHHEQFNYMGGRAGLGVVSFTWQLGQDPFHGRTTDETSPATSPIMPGGLFAQNRSWFLHLGGYDQEMRLYGGEEMEISFRNWMCGGGIDFVPCSHVGHVFRSDQYWKGVAHDAPMTEIARNKLRTAAVWMDKYQQIVRFRRSGYLPEALPLGDLSPRLKLRIKLQCKNFSWYLQNVAPHKPVPELSGNATFGALQNGLNGLWCLDARGNMSIGDPINAQPCQEQGIGQTSQSFVMDSHGFIFIPDTDYTLCVAFENKSERIVLGKCKAENSRWVWDSTTFQMKSQRAERCMAPVRAKNQYIVMLKGCNRDDRLQVWKWKDLSVGPLLL